MRSSRSFPSLRTRVRKIEETSKRKEELLAAVSGTAGRHHYGKAGQAWAEASAETIVQEELAGRRWTEETLALRRKGDAEKVRLAVRLRRETTMTVKWIAERLQMGTPACLTHLLYWDERGGKMHETMG